MRRREFIGGTLGVMATPAPSRAIARPHQVIRRPNIVLIVAEDLSPRIGCFGDSLARTPSIDALANSGVRYTHAFTTAPVCAPSRAALVTGMHQTSIGAQHMRTMGAAGLPGGAGFDYQAVPPPFVKAFPELLRAHGYYTTNAYKTDYQFGAPFTIWDKEEAALYNWRSRPADAPFFSMINLQVTHESFIWPIDMEGRTPLERAIVARNKRELTGKPTLTDPARVNVPPFLPDTPVVRRDLARFYDNIAIMDTQVGEIVAALDADGLSDNTIVIWTTDHGDGLPHAKRSLYDAGLKVPLIVHYPDNEQAGAVNDALFSFVDMAPSILALAGCPVPNWMYGRKVFGPSRSRAAPAIFAASDRMDEVPGRWRSVRTKTHQYLYNYMPERPFFEPLAFRDAMPTMAQLWALHRQGSLSPLQESQFQPRRLREELYDIRVDPDQIRNLAKDPACAGIMREMRRKLAGFQARVPDWSDQLEAEMVELRMWPNMRQPTTATPQFKWHKNGAFVLTCETPGASVGYKYSSESGWRLWHGPIEFKKTEPVLAKAIRYGYAESPIATSS